MVKAIIFDLDGTLLDTSRDIQSVLNASLKKFSLPEITLEKTLEYIGDGARKLVERAVQTDGEIFEKVYDDYVENFAKCANENTVLYDGEEKALNYFASEKIKLAIVTNKPQTATDRVFAKFLAKFGFNEVLGQTEYYPLKPNPASTLAILERLGVEKRECLYVGDGDADVKVAAAAGLTCVSALWGYRSKEELEKAGAKIFVESFEELENLVKKLNGKL